MKRVKVELTGISPLLMNNPIAMLEEKTDKLRTEKRNPTDDAKKTLYLDENGKLYVPSTAIKGTLINAAAYRKFGKYAAKSIVAGGVTILPEKIILEPQKWEIDYRTVVIQRARVPKARGKVSNWKLSFELLYNEKLIGSSELIKPILEDAGERVGILDFRPQRMGSFGMFRVTKWKEE